MWTKKVDRKELAEILNFGGVSLRTGLRESQQGIGALASSEDIELLWGDNPVDGKRLPLAIIVDSQKHKEILAWINTYVPSIRPVTAYCHILDRQGASFFATLGSSPRLGKLTDACLGLILGEAATYVSNKKGMQDITHAACLSTLSFSIARAAGFGFDNRFISDVKTRWSHTRDIIGAPPLPISIEPVEAAWSVIGQLSEGHIDVPSRKPVNQFILEACSQIFTNGAIQDHGWEYLTKEIPQLGPLQGELIGPREDRLLLFESAIEAFRQSQTRGNPKAEFLCAYLASSISPGTLDHLHILPPYLDSFPNLLIWYGLCAGLSSKGSFESELNGLVRRIKRDLLREDHILQTPSCDIAFDELDVISGSARDLTDLPTSTSGLLIVELHPCINSHFRFRRSEGASEATSIMIGSFLSDLSDSIERTSALIDRFRRVAGVVRTRTRDFERGKRDKSRR